MSDAFARSDCRYCGLPTSLRHVLDRTNDLTTLAWALKACPQRAGMCVTRRRALTVAID